MQLNFFDDNDILPKGNPKSLNSAFVLTRIPGLEYVPEFISEDEHKRLWEAINSEAWLSDIKRRVQHYGWRYDYKARTIDFSMFLGELPLWAQPYAKRLLQSKYLPKSPDQLIINEYDPGQGITNHVDCKPCFGETIISISLGSKCIMDFINLNTSEKIEILLEPRSLVVISNEARYNWSHGIPARKIDIFNGERFHRQQRISMTFRNVIVNSKDKTN